eukprot:GEZU01011643.1.p1 GENE.GEZU01011643.1~~GEZU01011643.1.p1  ORF type:complete len:212 (+),score=48.53 GEZU01011643.1:94-729(+)
MNSMWKSGVRALSTSARCIRNNVRFSNNVINKSIMNVKATLPVIQHSTEFVSVVSRSYAAPRTEIILKQDYQGLGFEGEVKKVKPGFMRNFLHPKGIAIYATEQNKQRYAKALTPEKLEEIEERRRGEELRRKFVAIGEFTMIRHAPSPPALHSEVNRQHIADKLLAKKNIRVTPEDVLLEEPIKELGTFTVPIRISKFDTFDLKLNVIKR